MPENGDLEWRHWQNLSIVITQIEVLWKFQYSEPAIPKMNAGFIWSLEQEIPKGNSFWHIN